MSALTTPRQDGFAMPAEWAPHQAVWMCWPYRTDNWRANGAPAQQAFAARPGTAPLEVPIPTPSATASAGGMNDENMPGMNHGDMGGMTDEEMPGMNHSDPEMNDDNMPGMHHEETSGMSDEEMPGMNHGGTTVGGTTEAGGSGANNSSHSHAEEPTSSEPRPTAALVGAFAAVNAGVMGTAFVLRRRERGKGGERRGRATT